MDKDAIKRQLTFLDDIEAHIEDAKIQLVYEQERLAAYFDKLSKREEESALVKLGHYLYWQTSLPTKYIGRLFGGMRNGLVKRIGLEASGKVCEDCGAALYWTSRTHMNGEKWEPEICNDCHRKRQKALSKKTDDDNTAFYRQQENYVKALKALPYAEYLKTEHWQSLRKKALKKASYRCQLCNAKVPLDVHHRTYERLGQEYLADVIVLCRECHRKFHDKQGEKNVRETGVIYVTDRQDSPDQ